VKIMFVTGSLAYGGAEHHAVVLANRLFERGHDCCTAYVKPESDQLGRLSNAGDDTSACFDAARFFDWQAVRRAAAYIGRVRPAVLVAANPYALMYGSLALWVARLRIPRVGIYHSMRWPGLKEQAKLLAYRGFMWTADCTVFVCQSQRTYCVRRGLCSRRNAVIYNGVDPHRFKDALRFGERQRVRAALGYGETDFVIAMVAALRAEKNHVQLVDAIAALRQAGRSAKALMIGDGPMRQAVEARAQAFGVEPHVTITGFRPDVRPFLAACNAVAICSLTEALSLAALEAMAMSKPIVHTAVGGAAELVEHGRNGLLVPRGNTAALVDSLETLTDSDLAHRMGDAGRHLAETTFSERRMIDRYERLLLEVGRMGAGVAEAAPA
jgi:glycosyltransferase involved in cell wall biosynthesis